MRSTLITIAAIALCPFPGAAQRSDWNAAFPAHRVMDNLYFVGTKMLGTFLIATPDGHILINSDYETTVPVIRASVEELGFKFEDIKIVLGSHAHDDHMQADALVKELTGAQVMAMRGDLPALRAMRPGGKEHPIDRVLDDGDEVTLGGTTLTAHLMPGHTKGCVSWGMELEENGQRYQAQILCSFGILGKLIDNEEYPEIADDFVASFAKARALPVDVFLGSHGFFYDMESKYQKSLTRAAGEPNPFIDHAGYLRYIDQQEQAFRSALEEQRNAAKTTDANTDD